MSADIPVNCFSYAVEEALREGKEEFIAPDDIVYVLGNRFVLVQSINEATTAVAIEYPDTAGDPRRVKAIHAAAIVPGTTLVTERQHAGADVCPPKPIAEAMKGYRFIRYYRPRELPPVSPRR